MIKIKKTILILILICLSSFVFAEDSSDNHCGNDICESFEETEGNCCEDCGGCNEITVETRTMDVVKPSEMDVDTGIIEVADKEEADENVQKLITSPDFKSYSSDDDLITATASASRYLTKEGYTDLGKKYMELATRYDQKRSQWGTISMYSQTAELYQEAEELWQG